MKYVVERNWTFTFIVEADCEEDAEGLAMEQSLDDAHEGFECTVSAYPFHQSTYYEINPCTGIIASLKP